MMRKLLLVMCFFFLSIPSVQADTNAEIKALKSRIETLEKKVEQLSKKQRVASLKSGTDFRAVPYFKNGKRVGFRLFAMGKDSAPAKLGLKSGDIVYSVNDEVLVDYTEVGEKLSSKGSKKIELERNHEKIVVETVVK